MGAPIHIPAMRGADAFTFEAPGTRDAVPVRRWRYQQALAPYQAFEGWFAFWRPPGGDGVQIVYAGNHPADIPRSQWAEWFGPAHELEMWNAARRELRITNHPLPEPPR